MNRNAERRALLIRISELIVNPSAVPLLDHYVDRLVALDYEDGRAVV